MKRFTSLFPVLLTLLFASFVERSEAAEPIKVGVIGLDNYQAVAFTYLFHRAKEDEVLSELKVVCAVPVGSPDIEESVKGLPRWGERFKEMEIEFTDSIDTLLKKWDRPGRGVVVKGRA